MVSHPDGSERKISIGKRLPNKELVLDSTVVSSPHGSERKISIVFFCFSLRYDLKCPLIGRWAVSPEHGNHLGYCQRSIASPRCPKKKKAMGRRAVLHNSMFQQEPWKENNSVWHDSKSAKWSIPPPLFLSLSQLVTVTRSGGIGEEDLANLDRQPPWRPIDDSVHRPPHRARMDGIDMKHGEMPINVCVCVWVDGNTYVWVPGIVMRGTKKPCYCWFRASSLCCERAPVSETRFQLNDKMLAERLVQHLQV